MKELARSNFFCKPILSQRIIAPILGRISTIKFEKYYLEQELYLN